jgi:hypothetical protein
MSSYFQRVPDFNYVSRLPDSKIGDYIRVKNLFKKGKLREDIFQNLAFFEKYKIVGDDRPDNVAFEIYKDSSLDWVVLLSNNVLNIQSEWPLPQTDFDRFVLDKYGTMEEKVKYYKTRYGISNVNENSIPGGEEIAYQVLYDGIHHYETIEIKNTQGVTIVPAGLQVDSSYSVSYYDFFTDLQVTTGNLATPITNYEYEEKVENDKRNIYILKPRYLNIVFDDMEEIMQYKKGSSQFVSESLKNGDNIKLYS